MATRVTISDVCSQVSNMRYSAPLFKKLNIFDIFKLNTHCIGKFMFSYSRDLLPECFENLFTFNNQIHDHNARAATKYGSYACRTNIKQFTILHRVRKLELPSPINYGKKHHFVL